MLTKYYYLLRKALYEGTAFEGTTFNGRKGDNYFLGYKSTYHYQLYEFTNGQMGTSYGDYNQDRHKVIVVGSGTTPETKDDHTIQDLTPQFTHVSNAYSCAIKENGLEHTWVRVLRNDTDSDIIIREIGFIEQTYSTAGTGGYPFLVFRKVLENEVTVPVGSTITINLVIGEGVEDVIVS